MNRVNLLFDGGTGTYFAQKNHKMGLGSEYANLSNPKLIREIHTEYLEAGCNAIKTNTFAVNRIAMAGDEEKVKEIIAAAWENACAAVKDYEAEIFADIGPISNLSEKSDVAKEYCFVAQIFLELGAKKFLFETNANTEGLKEAAAYIKQRCPDAYIITSFAVLPDGYTRDGAMVSDLLEEIKACKDVDVFGLNCVCGARHMLSLIQDLNLEGVTFAAMPNAGYPIVINNRTFYDGDPKYFAEQLAKMAALGVKILGGCCGTTPAHIEFTKKALDGIPQIVSKPANHKEEESLSARLESPFWNRLKSGKKVVAVELDSPANTNLDKFMSGAWELKGAGADIITIADCPIARARMDSTLLACKIKREMNLDAMPHMTCRDRNLNATKALLLGSYAEGIRNVLLITGDPIPTAERDEVKSVYQFNSRKLAGFVGSLGKNVLPDEFHMFGALNVNAVNFDVQIRLAKEKMERGIIGFLTQPVLTKEALDNIKRAKQELGAYILGGVIPVVSARNARFMNSEISGIKVAPEIIERYEGKDRAQSEQLAIEISVDIMKKISPYVDGYYLMTPFGRTRLIAEILKAFAEQEEV
ncbi:bifunctional homocysteine S-methyltransferase/methylenetetrahydrofolate reductase [Eubacterium oxidoreducens]|uniref:Homocysteine S-methyltransferase n=1 Tax=Eubacterium oxidoreducens TaxID=1732 RepID=A0A1G6AW49_EUBOX|nr:bifunctional homocysteine S-methyltransferase/methylenetetrahydrofolate reductase [Eubacterium oxidoreducens]SDB12620.1 homocysteine S-methyltransferase [Eubacterium oxidoreducens]